MKKVYLFKFGLKTVYHHVDMFEPHQEFLGYSWELNGKISYTVFIVLPFGLTSVPLISTKVTRPLRANTIKMAYF